MIHLVVETKHVDKYLGSVLQNFYLSFEKLLYRIYEIYFRKRGAKYIYHLTKE